VPPAGAKKSVDGAVLPIVAAIRIIRCGFASALLPAAGSAACARKGTVDGQQRNERRTREYFSERATDCGVKCVAPESALIFRTTGRSSAYQCLLRIEHKQGVCPTASRRGADAGKSVENGDLERSVAANRMAPSSWETWTAVTGASFCVIRANAPHLMGFHVEYPISVPPPPFCELRRRRCMGTNQFAPNAGGWRRPAVPPAALPFSAALTSARVGGTRALRREKSTSRTSPRKERKAYPPVMALPARRSDLSGSNNISTSRARLHAPASEIR